MKENHKKKYCFLRKNTIIDRISDKLMREKRRKAQIKYTMSKGHNYRH